MFDDEILKQAAEKYAEAIIDSMPEPSACVHDYSEEFEQRIRQIKDEHLTVHNHCSMALPKITVTIKSGQTTYRFNGSYDGTRSLPSKLLDHMANDSEKV